MDVVLDGIFTQEAYFFGVDDGPSMFLFIYIDIFTSREIDTFFSLGINPIVPSFQNWKYPHDRIPDSCPHHAECPYIFAHLETGSIAEGGYSMG